MRILGLKLRLQPDKFPFDFGAPIPRFLFGRLDGKRPAVAVDDLGVFLELSHEPPPFLPSSGAS